jgi:hypothetical protein
MKSLRTSAVRPNVAARSLGGREFDAPRRSAGIDRQPRALDDGMGTKDVFERSFQGAINGGFSPGNRCAYRWALFV